MKCSYFTGTGEKLSANKQFYNLISCTAEVLTPLCIFFLTWVQYHFTHIPPSGYEVSDIGPGSKNTQRSKNFCSTRDQVAKLFITVLVNYGSPWGGGSNALKAEV
jgi:hypothetical protein